VVGVFRGTRPCRTPIWTAWAPRCCRLPNGIVPDIRWKLPNLQLISGDGQSGPLGRFPAPAVVVQITDWYGNPLTNAPVTFSVTSGLNHLAAFEGETRSCPIFCEVRHLCNATVCFSAYNARSQHGYGDGAERTDTEQITFTDYEGNVADPEYFACGRNFYHECRT